VIELKGEAREVALAEAQAVLAAGGSVAELVAEIDEGAVVEEVAALQQVLELGLQAGRIRALYGPGGEQAALRVYRKLPAGQELAESAKGVTEALAALAGAELESLSVQAVGPGAFTLNVSAGGRELQVRLDRSGARLASVSL
jgi:hypothetical protein